MGRLDAEREAANTQTDHTFIEDLGGLLSSPDFDPYSPEGQAALAALGEAALDADIAAELPGVEAAKQFYQSRDQHIPGT